MSDRIAVFNDGVIQQLSSPDDLYERPENAFVAQFIGENNKLMGTVTAVEGDEAVVDIDGGGQARALAVACGGVGSRTQLSIRPERISVGADDVPNKAAAKVEDLIYHGDHIRCRMSVLGNDDFVVKVPNTPDHAPLAEGETTTVGWRTADCRALDAA